MPKREKRVLKVVWSPDGYFVANKSQKISGKYPTKQEAESQRQYLASR